MNKIFIYVNIFLFFSCTINNEKKSHNNEKITDSILQYYHFSKEKNRSLAQQYKAINISYRFAKLVRKDTLYTKVLFQKNLLHLSSKEYDSLFLYQRELINHAKRINDKFNLGQQYYLNGYYYNVVESVLDSAFYNYNKSKGYFSSARDSSWIGKCLYNMGTIQKNKNDYFGSKETLTEAIGYLDTERDSKYLSSSYSTLATNHRKLLNYQDALKYYVKAIETTNSEKDKLIYRNNLAATYIDNKQYNKATIILESLSRDSLSTKNNKEYARVLDNLAYAKWLSGVDVGEMHFYKALQFRKESEDQRGQIASYTHLGEFYSKENTQKATAYFDSVIQLSKKQKIPRAEKDALRFLMKIDSKNVFIRDRYVVLNDSLYAQELKVKTQFAKYKYDDKLKQESILRLEKENAEKELDASQQRNQKVLYLGGFLFITSVFGLSLYGFRQRTKRLKQKNKTTKLAAIFETEAQLARRVHDDFGAKLNHSMSLIQNDTDKEVVLDYLDALYNQSRDFSREINEVDTGENYKEELFQMFRAYTINIKLYTIGTKEIQWTSINTLSKTVLFKVLRELMINMGKYSQATTVTISFKKVSGFLKVNYADNGVGASKEEFHLKNGLRITENRIKAINGTIIFDSEKGKGFKAQIQIPN